MNQLNFAECLVMRTLRNQRFAHIEEHNLSPFDLNIACLCQSIEINNRKYVYRQSQFRKSADSGVKWAECSLIIGTGCRVQVFFSLILDSSVGLSASIQSAGDLVSGTPGSNPAFSRGPQLASFRFEYRLPVPEHRNWQQQICISSEPGAKVNWQWGQVGWMLADHRDGLSSSSFLAWSSIAQSVGQRAFSMFSLLAIWCLGPRDQILHSAEEHNLSPFDLNIACLCQSIEINNNKNESVEFCWVFSYDDKTKSPFCTYNYLTVVDGLKSHKFNVNLSILFDHTYKSTNTVGNKMFLGGDGGAMEGSLDILNPDAVLPLSLSCTESTSLINISVPV